MTTIVGTIEHKEKDSSSMSKHIVLSDEQYKADYDALESSADREVENSVIDQIKQKVANQMIKSKNFLDIGCGPGRITKDLSSLFQSTAVIEPNSCQLENFREYPHIKIFNTTFEDYYSKLSTSGSIDEAEKFDFILCSHVFYHIPDEDWTSVIGKLALFFSLTFVS